MEDLEPLAMSDEDIMNMPSPFPSTEEDKNDENIEKENNEEEEAEEIDDLKEEEEEEDSTDNDEEFPPETEEEESLPEEKQEDLEEDELAEKNPKEEAYDAIFAPFKANGQEVSVKTPEEVIKLMQMGMGYADKMHALKPSLKTVKMLKNNGLLDPDKLSFLIDVSKGDPEAIKKLVNDFNLDPMADDDEDKEYKPNTYTVDDNEIELDDVISDISRTPTYEKTVDIISNKWDDSSKDVLYKNPTLIKVINEHVGNGIYDRINAEIAKQRALGNLTGMSDIEVYKTVGDKIQNEHTESAIPTNKKPPTKSNSKLKGNKRAAGIPKNSSGSKKKSKVDYDPLALSDEEFLKLADPFAS